MVVQGANEPLYSREGVTLGDPLSMYMYAIGILLLTLSLKDMEKWVQVWYADDASASSDLENLSIWFQQLTQKGPTFGYVKKPLKCYVIVDDKDVAQEESYFCDLRVNVVTSQRLLGGITGDVEGREKYMKEKVQKWVKDVEHLSQIAVMQLQAAYAAFTRSLKCEWKFLQPVIPDCGALFVDLEQSLAQKFQPAIFVCEVTELERNIFPLPVCFGRMNVNNPTQMSEDIYTNSRRTSKWLVQAITGDRLDEIEAHGQLQ